MSIKVVNSLNLGGLVPDRVTRDALQAAADHVGEIAQEKAPLLVDIKRANDERRAHPGELRDSMRAEVVDDTTATVGFYVYWAAWMNEDLNYHHPDGQALFLTEPMVTEKDPVMQIMADKIREGLQQ